MKFTGFKTSFKGGMVSPRLRGRQKEGEINSAVEKLENFIIDRTGGATRRKSISSPVIQAYKNAGDVGGSRFDSYPMASTTDSTYFAVKLKGREFVFRFDLTKAFNTVNNPSSTAAITDLQSKFLSVLEPGYPASGSDFWCKTRVYAPNSSNTAGAYNMEAMTNFTYSITGASPMSTQVKEYLAGQMCRPVQMTKVSDATVVFSCSSGISFSVTLANVPYGTYNSEAQEFFLILPYFVNVRAWFANIGHSAATATTYNFVRPTNFPFNILNSNTNYTVSTAVVAGQTGATTADSVLSYQGDKLVHLISVPKEICLFQTTGQGGNSAALEGKFIILPLATDNSKDVVFFITKYESETPAGTFRYYAMRIIGGTPTSPTSLWRISTFGGESHPKVVDYNFGRLLYGNAGVELAKWWVSAIHPSSLTDFQGFMGFSLGQDLTSDVSHMNYEGITQPKINDAAYVPATDVYRYGFSATTPNLSQVNFITSRRKIHFGTDDGETQAELAGDSFAKTSYSQISVRTNSAYYAAITKGDGRFFYLSNQAKDVRAISTEDRYYESQDELLTTALEGLDLIFEKIIWYEKLNSVVALTNDGRVFFITTHQDTQIKAVSELKSVFTIVDICASSDNLFFILSDGTYQHICKYLVLEYTSISTTTESDWIGEFAVTYPFTTGSPNNPFDMFAIFQGQTVYAFFKGVEYSFVVPNPWDGLASSLPIPFTLADANYTDRAFFYAKKVTSKIRSIPIDEGGQGGTAVGDAHRIDQIEFMVDNSGPFKAGTEDGTKYDVEGLSVSTLSTKYVKFDFPQTSDDENHFYIETDKPTPLNISGVAYRGKSDPGV